MMDKFRDKIRALRTNQQPNDLEKLARAQEMRARYPEGSGDWVYWDRYVSRLCDQLIGDAKPDPRPIDNLFDNSEHHPR